MCFATYGCCQPCLLIKILFISQFNIVLLDQRLVFFVISLGRVVVPSRKIVKNLPGTYEKLPCKGKSYRFSSYRDPSVQTNTQTNTQTDILLLQYKDTSGYVFNILFYCIQRNTAETWRINFKLIKCLVYLNLVIVSNFLSL